MATGASATAGGPPEAAYGLCYGTMKRNVRLPAEQILEKYRVHGISKMWLSPASFSPPNEDIIAILKLIIKDPVLKSEMKIVLCIDYKDLQILADYDNAKDWVGTYVTDYVSVISHVCIGDVSVSSHVCCGDVVGSANFSLAKIFREAMSHLRKLLKLLQNTIKLSIIVDPTILLGKSYTAYTKPSACNLTKWSQEVLQILCDVVGSPITLFVQIMPYFMIANRVPIKNCLLGYEGDIYMTDGPYKYTEAFDAMIDSVYCALQPIKESDKDKVGIIAVSGWPTNGPTIYAAEQYAKQYITNLVPYIGHLTPRGKKPVDTFIYSLVDEELLPTLVEEFKHLGAEAYLPFHE